MTTAHFPPAPFGWKQPSSHKHLHFHHPDKLRFARLRKHACQTVTYRHNTKPYESTPILDDLNRLNRNERYFLFRNLVHMLHFDMAKTVMSLHNELSGADIDALVRIMEAYTRKGGHPSPELLEAFWNTVFFWEPRLQSIIQTFSSRNWQWLTPKVWDELKKQTKDTEPTGFARFIWVSDLEDWEWNTCPALEKLSCDQQAGEIGSIAHNLLIHHHVNPSTKPVTTREICLVFLSWCLSQNRCQDTPNILANTPIKEDPEWRSSFLKLANHLKTRHGQTLLRKKIKGTPAHVKKQALGWILSPAEQFSKRIQQEDDVSKLLKTLL